MKYFLRGLFVTLALYMAICTIGAKDAQDRAICAAVTMFWAMSAYRNPFARKTP